MKHINDFLSIGFSHQDNGELHMSQTGLIDAVTEVHTFPKVNSKTPQHPGTILPLLDNSMI
jgi:hypothetical protein